MRDEQKIEIQSELKEALTNTEGKDLRVSKKGMDYVLSRSNGQPLSLNVRKTFNIIVMQNNPEDIDFFDYVVDDKKLAESIGVSLKNLRTSLTKGDFVEEIMNSKFSDIRMDEKGEIYFEDTFNVMSRFKYEDHRCYFRINPDMKPFLLQLGSGNPYIELNVKTLNSLSSQTRMELYREVKNKLLEAQYDCGFRKKWQMMTDYEWYKLKISIYRIRKITFSLNRYLKIEDFKIFIKRMLVDLAKSEDIEVKTEVKTDKMGAKAKFVIIEARRKNNNLIVENHQFFTDHELNNLFWEFVNMINPLNDRRIELFKKKLIELTESEDETSINTELAKKIVEQSIRNDWKDFYPITVNDKVKNNTEEVPEKELFMKKHMNTLKLEFEQGYNGSFEEFCEKKYRERFI